MKEGVNFPVFFSPLPFSFSVFSLSNRLPHFPLLFLLLPSLLLFTIFISPLKIGAIGPSIVIYMNCSTKEDFAYNYKYGKGVCVCVMRKVRIVAHIM